MENDKMYETPILQDSQTIEKTIEKDDNAIREVIDPTTGTKNLFRGSDAHGENIFSEDYVASVPVKFAGEDGLKVIFSDGTVNYVSLSTGKTAFKEPVELTGEPLILGGREYERVVLEDGIGLYDKEKGEYLFDEPVLSVGETEDFGRKLLHVRFAGKRFNYIFPDTGEVLFPQPARNISSKSVKLGMEEYAQVVFGATENLYSRKTMRPVVNEPYRAGTLESFRTNRFLQYTAMDGTKNILDLNGDPLFKEGFQASEPCRRYGSEYLRVFFADGTQNFIGEDGRFIHTRFNENLIFLTTVPLRFGTEKSTGPDGNTVTTPMEWDLVAYPDGTQNLLNIKTGKAFFEKPKTGIRGRVFPLEGNEYVCINSPSRGMMLISPSGEHYSFGGKELRDIEGPVSIFSTPYYDIYFKDGTRDLVSVATGEGLFAGEDCISIRQAETGFIVMNAAGNESLVPYQSLGLATGDEKKVFDIDALRAARVSDAPADGNDAEREKQSEWLQTIGAEELQAAMSPYVAGPDALGIPHADRMVLSSLFAAKDSASDVSTLKEVYSLLSAESRSVIYSNAPIRRIPAAPGREAGFVAVHPDDWFAGLADTQMDLALRIYFSSGDVPAEEAESFRQFLEDAKISRVDAVDMKELFKGLSLESKARIRDTFVRERSARFARALTNCSAASLRSLVAYARDCGLPAGESSRLSQEAAISACTAAFAMSPDVRLLAKAETEARAAAGDGAVPPLVCEPFHTLYVSESKKAEESAHTGPYPGRMEDGRYMLFSEDGTPLLAEPVMELTRASEIGLGVTENIFVAKGSDGRLFFMNGSGIRQGGLYDFRWQMQTEGRLAMETERFADRLVPVGPVTVMDDPAQVRRMVRRKEAIDTTKGRFSNPFLPGTKVAGKLIATERDSAYAYLAWLVGADYTDFRQGQRNEVLDDILLCRLSGRRILTDALGPADGSYGDGVKEFSMKQPSHAYILSNFITHPRNLLSRIHSAQAARLSAERVLGERTAVPAKDDHGQAVHTDGAAHTGKAEDSAVLDASPEVRWFAGLTTEERKNVLTHAALPAGMDADEQILVRLSEDLDKAFSPTVSKTETLLAEAFFSLSPEARRAIRAHGVFAEKNTLESGFDVYVTGFDYKSASANDIVNTLSAPGFDKEQKVIVLNTRLWKQVKNPDLKPDGLRRICASLGYEYADVDGLDMGSGIVPPGSAFKELRSSAQFASFMESMRSYRRNGYKVLLLDTFPWPGHSFTSTDACQQLERDGLSVAHILPRGKIQNHDFCMSRFIHQIATSGRMRDIDFEYYGKKDGIKPVVPSSVKLARVASAHQTSVQEGAPTAGFPITETVSNKEHRMEVYMDIAEKADLVFVFSNGRNRVRNVSFTEDTGNTVSAAAQRLNRTGSKSEIKTGTFVGGFALKQAKKQRKVIEISFPDDPSMVDGWKEEAAAKIKTAISKKLSQEREKSEWQAAGAVINGEELDKLENTFDLNIAFLGANIAAIGNTEKVVVSADETTGEMYNQLLITPTGFEQKKLDNMFSDLMEMTFPDGRISTEYNMIQPNENEGELSKEELEARKVVLYGNISVVTSGESGIEQAAGVACQANRVPAEVVFTKNFDITLDNGTLRGESVKSRAVATGPYHMGDETDLDIVDRRNAQIRSEETRQTFTTEKEAAKLRDEGTGLPDRMIIYLSSRIPNEDVHRLVRLAQGESVTVDTLSENGETKSSTIVPETGGYLIHSAEDLSDFLEDMHREGAIGASSVLPLEEVADGLARTDAYINEMETKGVHLVTVRSPFYSDVLRNRTLTESETRPVLGLDIDTNGTSVSYNEREAAEVREEFKAAGHDTSDRDDNVAAEKPETPDRKPEYRISKSGRKHFKVGQQGTPVVLTEEEKNVGIAHVALGETNETQTLYLAPPPVIPYAGDPSNLNKPMVFIDGSALSNGSVEETPELRRRCCEVGRQFAERGVIVAADTADRFAMSVADGATAAGGSCVYSTSEAPDDPSVADYARNAASKGDTVLFNSLVADDGEKGNDTLEHIAARAAAKNNNIYFRRGRDSFMSKTSKFFGLQASMLMDGPDALIVFALATKGLQVAAGSASAVIDIFSPSLNVGVSVKADELWKKSASAIAKEIEDNREREANDRLLEATDQHPETYQFKVLRRGSEQVFVVASNLPDVREAIRNAYGENVRFARSMTEAKKLISTVAIDGLSVPVVRNDFAPGVTQAYDDPVYEEWLVYHDGTVSSVHLAPDSITELRPREERIANRQLLERARKHARSIMTELNMELGLPDAMNMQFANAMYVKEAPNGVYVYEGASLVGSITIDASGSLRVYSSNPVGYDLDEHHRHYEPVFPNTKIGFSKRSKDNNKKVDRESLRKQSTLSMEEIDKMFDSLGRRVLGYTDADVSKTALMDREERTEHARAIEEGFEQNTVSNVDIARQDLDEALAGNFSLSMNGVFMCEKNLADVEKEINDGREDYIRASARVKELPGIIGSLSDSNPEKTKLAKELSNEQGVIARYESLFEKREAALAARDEAMSVSQAARYQAVLYLEDAIGQRNVKIRELKAKLDSLRGNLSEAERNVHKLRDDATGTVDGKKTKASSEIDKIIDEITQKETALNSLSEKNAQDRVLQEYIAVASMVEPLGVNDNGGKAVMKEKSSRRRDAASDAIRTERARAYAIAFSEMTKIEHLMMTTEASLRRNRGDLGAIENRIVELKKKGGEDPTFINEFNMLASRREKVVEMIAKEEKKLTALAPRKKANALARQQIVTASEILFSKENDKKSGKEKTVIIINGQKIDLKVAEVPENIFVQASKALDTEYRRSGERAKYLIVDGHQVEVPVMIGKTMLEDQIERAESLVSSIRNAKNNRVSEFRTRVAEVESGRSVIDTSKSLKGDKSVSSKEAEMRLIAEIRARYSVSDAVRPEGLLPENGPINRWSFKGLNLTGLNFSGCDLSGIDFAGSTIEGCNFVNTRLDGCDFSQTKISDSDFSGAKMDNIQFRGAQLELCTFHKADLSGMNAAEARFSGCDLYRSSVKDASLSAAAFSDCRIDYTQMDGAVLSSSTWLKCAIRNCTLRDCASDGMDVRTSIVQSCDLSGMDVTSVQVSSDIRVGNIIEDVPVAAESNEAFARKEEIVGEPSNEMFIIERNGLFAYADSETMKICSSFYPKIEPFKRHHGVVVLPDGLIQWVDRKGTALLPEPVEKTYGISENKLLVRSHSGKYNHINLMKEGRPYVSPVWTSYAGHFQDGWALIRASEEEEGAGKYGKFNYINENGDLLSPRWFLSASDFKDGRAVVSFNETEKVELRADEIVEKKNEKGEIVNMPILDYARTIPAVPSLVFTSYYGNMKRLPKDAFIVQTSNSIPDGITPSVKWNRVIPDWETVDTYRKEVKAAESITDSAEKERMIRLAQVKYRNAYWGKLYNQTKFIARNMTRLLKEAAGRPVFLMCYEKTGGFCHRNILAEFINTEIRKYVPEKDEEFRMSLVPVEEAPGSFPAINSTHTETKKHRESAARTTPKI